MTAGAYLTRLGRIHGLGRAAATRGALEWLERFGAAAYVPSALIATVVVLFAGASPANAAVTGLVTGSRTGVVHVPLLPPAAAGALAAGAVAVACALASRRA
ncbi:hypothetical protein ABZY03_00035 [Streptomyces klenkii]|uniref:hypothetical protein n=1 Tax=Streptomyces klenkii TaxID=1420899 RepID=UPI0033BC3D22